MFGKKKAPQAADGGDRYLPARDFLIEVQQISKIYQ